MLYFTNDISCFSRYPINSRNIVSCLKLTLQGLSPGSGESVADIFDLIYMNFDPMIIVIG